MCVCVCVCVNRLSPEVQLVLAWFTWGPDLQAGVSAVYNAGWHNLSLSYVCFSDPDTVQALPPFPPLNTFGAHERITNAMLAAVLVSIPKADLRCESWLALTSALPAGAPRPWHTVETTQLSSIAEWLMQAEMLGGDPCWKIRTTSLSLSADEVRGLISYSHSPLLSCIVCVLCVGDACIRWCPVCMFLGV